MFQSNGYAFCLYHDGRLPSLPAGTSFVWEIDASLSGTGPITGLISDGGYTCYAYDQGTGIPTKAPSPAPTQGLVSQIFPSNNQRIKVVSVCICVSVYEYVLCVVHMYGCVCLCV